MFINYTVYLFFYQRLLSPSKFQFLQDFVYSNSNCMITCQLFIDRSRFLLWISRIWKTLCVNRFEFVLNKSNISNSLMCLIFVTIVISRSNSCVHLPFFIWNRKSYQKEIYKNTSEGSERGNRVVLYTRKFTIDFKQVWQF